LPLIDTSGNNNRALIQTPLPVLMCPSDPTSAVRSDLANWWAWPAVPTAGTAGRGPAGVTCYMGFSGSAHDTTGEPDAPFKRATPAPAKVKIASLLEATSNTLMVGERSPSYSPWCAWAAGNGVWILDAYPINQIRKTVPSPPTTNQEIGGERYGAISLHLGGMHGLFGDGSVQFLSETMNFTTYQQLDRHRDGGPVGGFTQN
jgi:hypothetical protein